jgi:hypothetical protein
MRSIGHDKAISQSRGFRCESEANQATPVVANDIGVCGRNAFIVGQEEGFSHGNDELSESLEDLGVGCVKAVASSVSWEVYTDDCSLSCWHCRLPQHVPPHHARVGEAMEEDEQVARLLTTLLIGNIMQLVTAAERVEVM